MASVCEYTMIKNIRIRNYRSIKDLALELSQINVVIGANGCGKSNLYKAINLISQASFGQLALHLCREGGLQNILWSGTRNNALAHAHRLILECELKDYQYQLQLGFPDKLPYPTQFGLDAVVKEESIWLAGRGRRPSAQLLERKNQFVKLSNINHQKVTLTDYVYENESIFSQLAEPHLYPEVSQIREWFRSWRFYHDFNIAADSVLRSPQPGYRSPVLASDGANLAAAFQTIIEIGNDALLQDVLSATFPDSSFYCCNDKGRFQLYMTLSGLRRPLEMYEMSDGTLRFLCLAVSLLSPRLPAFIVLNEPENSLHHQLLPALARLIAEAGRHSQIWLTSHSPELAILLAESCDFKKFELQLMDGETKLMTES